MQTIIELAQEATNAHQYGQIFVVVGTDPQNVQIFNIEGEKDSLFGIDVEAPAVEAQSTGGSGNGGSEGASDTGTCFDGLFA